MKIKDPDEYIAQVRATATDRVKDLDMVEIIEKYGCPTHYPCLLHYNTLVANDGSEDYDFIFTYREDIEMARQQFEDDGPFPIIDLGDVILKFGLNQLLRTTAKAIATKQTDEARLCVSLINSWITQLHQVGITDEMTKTEGKKDGNGSNDSVGSS